MTTISNDYRTGPASGAQAKYHILFLHGYGSGGRQMAEYVGRGLGAELPEARMYFPDGPDFLGQDEHGYRYHRWFEVEQDVLEERTPLDPAKMAARAFNAAAGVNEYIDRLLQEENIAASQLVIAGFSQGATMAFYAALLRDEPVAGVFTISGGALDRLDSPRSCPPAILAAGQHEQSDYCGVSQIVKNAQALGQKGFQADYYILAGQGHEIGDLGLECLNRFVRGLLTVKPAFTPGNTPGPGFGTPQP